MALYTQTSFTSPEMPLAFVKIISTAINPRKRNQKEKM
jgi:hypothetical protein